MIRFRTIDPETAANANVAAPPAEAPRLPPAPTEPTAADDTGKKAKGLTRKTPLRAKKQDAAPLFDDKAAASDGGSV